MQLTLSTLLSALPVNQVIGSKDRIINRVVRATDQDIASTDLLWVSDKNIDLLQGISTGTIICSQAITASVIQKSCTYLVVENPRFYFMHAVREFFTEQPEPFISPRSVIDASVKIGKDVTIHAGVVIEKNCSIGDNTIIDCNTVIKPNTVIGKNVKIGANNTIGGSGFGYEKNEKNEYEFIPHIGNVVIEDFVEIGNNTAIDRAVLGSTIIRRNAKVDNLVHIAHGCDIGENSMVIANAMIGGSTTIGRDVWVAPSVSVLNKLNVEDAAVLGMGAVVLKNVLAGQTVVGNPAKDLQSLKKSS